MSAYLDWVLLLGGLVLGVLGGLLGAWVSTALYWALWLPALACVGVYIYRSGRTKAGAAHAPAGESDHGGQGA